MLSTRLTAFPAQVKGASGSVDRNISDEAIRQTISELEKVAAGESAAVMKWRAEEPAYAAWVLLKQIKYLVSRVNILTRDQ